VKYVAASPPHGYIRGLLAIEEVIMKRDHDAEASF
jgi:hypothetical protein